MVDDSEPQETESDDSLVGQLLDDRYEIRKSLDRGGMGTVYLAWDRTLERQVVVKIPHASLMADRTFRERFLQEIRDLSTHEHPAILSIVDSGSHEGSHGDVPYAVVQYLRGGNLRERITQQGGQQSREEILEWLPTIAGALDTVHRNGSLHRDVKPANILFDGEGHAVLSDFGIATAIGAADPDAPTQEVRRELTVVGTFVGSPAYAPPEAIDRHAHPRLRPVQPRDRGLSSRSPVISPSRGRHERGDPRWRRRKATPPTDRPEASSSRPPASTECGEGAPQGAGSRQPERSLRQLHAISYEAFAAGSPWTSAGRSR